MGNDSLAQIVPADTAIGPPTATARRLVDASVSANTRRAYAGALRRLDAGLAGRPLDDVSLAAYIAELHDGGRASSSAAMAVAAACFARSSPASRTRPAMRVADADGTFSLQTLPTPVQQRCFELLGMTSRLQPRPTPRDIL